MWEPRRAFGAAAASFLICAVAQAAYKDDIGFTQLASELGGGTPTGAGIGVSQIEALLSGNYAPNQSDPEFSGKTFTLKSGASGTSSHATVVGRNLYGNATSIAPGITTIDNWEANNWLGVGFLKTNSLSVPAVEIRKIENHSWAGTFNDQSKDLDALRRFDYTINRDNYLAVVGVNNGGTTPVPNLLAHSYNAISVGRSDGSHSHGFTSFDEAGRIKPEIVAPLSATSYATPVVGAAGALLYETALGNPSLADADNSEAIKAILMAGATKDEFSGWDRTSARPLDDVYGAGELNIYNSYHVLVAGQQEASTSVDVATKGWDFDATPAQAPDKLYYFFEAAQAPTMLSVILTWNREITDGKPGSGWGSPQASVADLSLRLYDADGFTLGTLLDSSLSAVDNVEHIYRPLAAGRYALEISSDTGATEFAMAWHSVLGPPLPGDANLDGVVDIQDFFIVKAHFDQDPADWADGNFNEDTLVDIQDFFILKDHFDQHFPEPTTLVLLLGGGIVAVLRYRGRETTG